ncbi:MAG: hypothetical protein AAFY19_06170 [Pseudomonadota bacterium]
MTKPNNAATDDDFDLKRFYLHLLGWSVLFAFALIGIIVIGFAAGYYSATQEPSDLWIMLIGVPILAVSGYFLWHWMPDFTMGEPDTPRGRRIRWTLIACGVVGGIASVPLIDTQGGGSLLFGNGPVPASSALLTAAIWGLLLPVLIVTYRRNADEVTREANNFGFSVGFQAFAYAAPLWWIGWRGGFLPTPDVMILFVATLVVATLANIWKQFA